MAAYASAVLAGVFAGWVDAKVNDLLLTVLLVLAPCMLLGAWKPRHAWRWTLLVWMPVPAAGILTYYVFGQRAYQGQRLGALLLVFPGFAGAYGGAFLRGVVRNLAGKGRDAA